MSINKIDSLKLMSGAPLVFENLDICITQPKLKDISYLGEAEFYSGISYFFITKEKLSIKTDISDFDLFMFMCTQSKEIQKKVSDILILTIEDLEKISFYDTFIILKFAGHECIIDEPKFLIIKETYKQIFCLDFSSVVTNNYNPVNEQAKKIADKLNKRKEFLTRNNTKSENNIFSNIISILVIGSKSLSISECLNMTVYQIYNILKRFNLYNEYDLQIKALMQGAKDIELVDWTKQI